MLPNKPYNVEGLRAVDATVRLKGKRIVTTDVPFDNLNAVMHLKDGLLKLQPLDVGIAGGRVASTLTMDVRGKVIKTDADVTVRNVELKQIVPALKPPKGSAGKVGGRAKFTRDRQLGCRYVGYQQRRGRAHQLGGDASELAIVLTNLDLARAIETLVARRRKLTDSLRGCRFGFRERSSWTPRRW